MHWEDVNLHRTMGRSHLACTSMENREFKPSSISSLMPAGQGPASSQLSGPLIFVECHRPPPRPSTQRSMASSLANTLTSSVVLMVSLLATTLPRPVFFFAGTPACWPPAFEALILTDRIHCCRACPKAPGSFHPLCLNISPTDMQPHDLNKTSV